MISRRALTTVGGSLAFGSKHLAASTGVGLMQLNKSKKTTASASLLGVGFRKNGGSIFSSSLSSSGSSVVISTCSSRCLMGCCCAAASSAQKSNNNKLNNNNKNLFRTIKRSMYIETSVTPNENALKFLPGVPVLDQGATSTRHYTDMRGAMSSPLARALMRVEGVTSVMLGQDFVTVMKDEKTAWNLLKPEVFAAIMDHFASGLPVVQEVEERMDTKIEEGDDETVKLIKATLDERIRPFVQEDGGDIKFVSFEDGVVKVALQGSCSSCPSSTITLKNGVENMLMYYVPGIDKVEQVEDPAVQEEQLKFVAEVTTPAPEKN